jgi:hypothetical protein
MWPECQLCGLSFVAGGRAATVQYGQLHDLSQQPLASRCRHVPHGCGCGEADAGIHIIPAELLGVCFRFVPEQQICCDRVITDVPVEVLLPGMLSLPHHTDMDKALAVYSWGAGHL